MKNQILAAVVVATTLVVNAKTDRDPVLMNVAGQNVSLSEFEYLYNKNNSQQVEPLTLDKYVDMFIDYKLKVADAKASGIDTTAQFIEEFVKFRSDLAEPYLQDQATKDRLLQEAYDHTLEEVFVSHIMLPNRPTATMANPKAVADSLREAIVSGRVSFEEVARKHSVDKGSAARGGKMGWVIPGRFPYPFEEASYDTPVNGISEVINSGVGYHIVRPEIKRPSRGEVEAQHILLLTRGKDPEQRAAVKERIDSIYQVVTTPGVDFSEMAVKFSEDPGSARQGGNLGWFGSGMMVAEFDSVAFALPDDAISEPFATSFGYHIVRRLGHRGPKSFDEIRDLLDQQMQQDARAGMPHAAYMANIEAATKSHIDMALFDNVRKMIADNGGVCDDALIASMAKSKLPAFYIDGKASTLAEVLKALPIQAGTDADATINELRSAVANCYNGALEEYARQQLEDTNADYRNLVNEYRDGIMLFEISNQKVWDRASKDQEGLNKYFDENRANYAWDKPRFKSYIVFAENDSVMALAKAYTDSLQCPVAQETIVNEMRTRFGRSVKVERVIAAEGENAITDYLGFGAEKPASEKSRWNSYYAVCGKIVDAPEDAADVRGQAVTDYQASLERQWLDELHKKYKVKVFDKVLKQVK